MYSHDKLGRQTWMPKWIVKIKQILDENGYSNIWDVQANINTKWFISSIDLKLKDIALQNWKTELERNRLCTNYRIFKEESKFENYLTRLAPVEKIDLCRFRCGNHRLPIKEARYNSNKEYVCTLCDSNEPGDEYHYVLVCQALRQSRKRFLKSYYYTRPNVLKLNQLFNVNDRS